MKNIICFFAKYPWLFLLLLLIVSALASTQLHKLSFNVSAESMLVEDDPDVDLYKQSLKNYGSDNIIITYLSDDKIFTPEKLKLIKSFVDQINALASVKSTDSLFNLVNLKSIEGEIKTDPYLASIPESLQELQQIKKEALFNPFIANNLVSKKANALAINIYIKASITGDEEKILTQSIEKAIEQLSQNINTVYQIGNPYVLQSITDRLIHDMKEILPLSLFVLMVTLGITIRRVGGLFIPLVTAGLSILWTLALMASLGISVNVMTSIVPALLVIIGSTEDIHLLSEYYTGINSGVGRKKAITGMASNMSTAISFTFFTTYIGFLSISLNNIEILSQFGLVASTGLLFNFIITIVFIPSILSLFGSTKVKQKNSNNNDNNNSSAPSSLKEEAKENIALNTSEPANQKTNNSFFQRIIVSLYLFVHNRKKSLFAITVIITLISLVGTNSLKVNNSSLDYFDENSEVMKRITTLQNNFSGMESLSIVIDSGIDETFLKLKYLDEIKKLQDFLIQSKIADLTLSFVDYMALLHVAMNEDPLAESNDGLIYLPEEDDVIREYMFFVNPKHVKSYISKNYSEARILVRHHISSSYELNKAIIKIQDYIDKNIDPGLKIHITGKSILSAKAADYMAKAQAESLILMTITIFIIISLLFFSLKAGLVATIPNIIPIIILFGVMGFFGIPLNTGTAMTAAIALGICVDDTMHFMVRYHHEIKKNINGNDILLNTVRSEAIPILSTSVALALGFSVMAVSSFPPITHFGLLSSFVILLALMATFVITPVLLSMTSLISIWDMLSFNLRKDVINISPLFKNMSEFQVRTTIALCEVNQCKKDVAIIEQGEEENDFYVLLDGQVDVSNLDSTGSRNHLTTLNPGDVFGEMAFASKQKRTADVISTSKVSVLRFNVNSMKRISRVYPRVANKLLINLSFILGSRINNIFNMGCVTHDENSGALKRHVFDAILSKEIHSANRYQDSMCLLLFSLKAKPNDDLSSTQLMIERIISHHADHVTISTRNVDVFARWDGNIFALLMPKTSALDAKMVRDRILEEPTKKLNIDINEITLQILQEEETEKQFLSRLEDSLLEPSTSVKPIPNA